MSKFIAVWDMYGLEYIASIDHWEYEHEENFLKMIETGKPVESEFGRAIQMLLLRARINSQRNYEIYAFQADDGISEKDLEKMFNENPQYSADKIREIGVKIYSSDMPKAVIK